MDLDGEVFKSRQGRTTLRFHRDGRVYFAKLHRGVGWGVLLRYQGREKSLHGGEPETTNNRMELRAAIEGLRALKEPCSVV